MSTLTEQFEKNPYKPKYRIGDRVFGYYNKIPFVATVGNDRTKVGGDPNPEVVVHLDLPLKYKNVIYNLLILKHKDIKQKLNDIV
jgi:hypothetical protein